VGGSVVHDPKDPSRLPIRLLFHDLLDQPIKRLDAGGSSYEQRKQNLLKR
jgi:hypothetical protein